MKSLFKTFLIILTFLFFTSSIGFAASAYNSFKTVTYTGNGSTQAIEVGFKPDLVWFKKRNTISNHHIFDSIRGVNNAVYSSNSNIEGIATSYLASFDPTGFTVKESGAVNALDDTYVAWCWKAGDEIVTNTDGSITATISANPDAGFSIVKYTGNGTASAAIGHGLGAAPKMIIVKNLSNSESWRVWHSNLSSQYHGLVLNATNLEENIGAGFLTNFPDTNTFHAGSVINTNDAEYIAYVWADTPDVSSFDSYTGSGSTNGPTIECGFEPTYVMIKRIDNSGSWHLLDNKRGNSNVLYPNLTNPEVYASNYIEFFDNGFKLTNTSIQTNASNGKYIYMAFAEREAPQIDFFTNKTSLDHKDGIDPEFATLSWNAPGADNIVIEPAAFISEDSSGILEITPDFPTTYTLSATYGTETLTQEVHIDVVNGYDEGTGFSLKGPMGIGVLNPTNMLEVKGTIKAQEVIVTMDDWADYVFDDKYKLQSLDEVEKFIKKNKHLPEMKSGSAIEKNGLSVSEILKIQQQKIEELTLYMIALKKENEIIKNQLAILKIVENKLTIKRLL